MSDTIDGGPVLATIREAHDDTLDQIDEWITGCIERGAMSMDLSAELRQAVAARRDELAAGAPDRPVVLEHLTRLELNPGDTLVATAPHGMQLHHMYASLKTWMDEHHPGVSVLVVPPGTELAVLGPGSPDEQLDVSMLHGARKALIRRGVVDKETARARVEKLPREENRC